MKTLTVAFMGLVVACLIQLPFAKASADGQTENYDDIVHDLTNQNRTSVPAIQRRDPLADSVIHAGLGLANNFETVRSAEGRRLDVNQSGVQAALGIDLFTPRWIAEGCARSFGDSQAGPAVVGLHEFDLKVINKGHLTGALGYRLGGGLSARYLDVQEPSLLANQGAIKNDYVTPDSVFSAGLEAYLSKKFSVGLEGSYRSALVSDTIDKVAFDLSVRLDTHF